MIKKNLALMLIAFVFFVSTSVVLADTKGAGDICKPSIDTCPSGYSCQFDSNLKTNLCQKSTVQSAFGTIQPPDALKKFIGTDTTGASGISQFLSNLVILIYSLAAMVLIFMILWGAFEWLTSGGDKEKLSSAQKRIINAFIGIILFAIAFAIIAVLGQFTGFQFFKGQGITVIRDNQGGIVEVRCPNKDRVISGTPAWFSGKDLTSLCD